MAVVEHQPAKVEDGNSGGLVYTSDDSSKGPPARFTPESGEDDDDDVDDGGFDVELDELQHHDAFALQELDARNGRPRISLDDSETGHDQSERGGLTRRRRRRLSPDSFLLYTPDEERRVRRKLHTHVVLFVAVLYLAAFLDRSNIGNAKIAGLTDDLSLSDSQYEWLLTAFYIAYILFQWTAVMHKLVPSHIWLSLCVASWGVLASTQALVRSWPPLLALRTLLGVGEAAFGSGVPFYLSFFIKRHEHAFATGVFIAAAPLATSFASSLAYVIVKLGDKIGIASWRLLFLVEGFPAILLAVWTFYWLPDSPATARWLSPRERNIAVLRLRKESDNDLSAERTTLSAEHKPAKLDLSDIAHTLRDRKAYLTAAIFFCCNVAFSSMPVFLPTIINDLGFSARTAQGLSAPPFLLAFFVVLITAWVSDRFKTRSIPLMFHGVLTMLGYFVLAFAGAFHLGSTIRYLAVFPICAGFFSAVTLTISWNINNQESDSSKGAAQAVLQTIGQLGPLLGTRLYPDADGPDFVLGHSVCAVAMALVTCLAYWLRLVLIRTNTSRSKRWLREGDDGVPLVGNGREKGNVFLLML